LWQDGIMKILNRKYLFYTYLFVLVLLAILPINSTNSSLNNNYIFSIRLDYFAHSMVVIPYFLLLFICLGEWKREISVLSVAFLFVSFLEVIQYFLPYRAYNINDMLANWLGILLSYMLFLLVKKMNKIEILEKWLLLR
jgi:glycopeptide antibiotics resistance protein